MIRLIASACVALATIAASPVYLGASHAVAQEVPAPPPLPAPPPRDCEREKPIA